MVRSVRRAFAPVLSVMVLACTQVLRAPDAPASAVTTTVSYPFSGVGALPSGWTYAPAQGCTDPSNVWLSGGELVMRVGQTGRHPYCGGRLMTQRTFNPPFVISIRARFHLPAGVHTGATLYGDNGAPWPANGEIDLDEMTSKSPTRDHERTWTQRASVRWPSRCGDQADPQGVNTAAWHTYTAAVGTDAVTFSLDGVPFHTTTKTFMTGLGCTWPYNQPEGLRLYLTASSGGWGGTPQGPGYPAYEEFDSVQITTLPAH
jgi:beta-glucanase (GH16 family)